MSIQKADSSFLCAFAIVGVLGFLLLQALNAWGGQSLILDEVVELGPVEEGGEAVFQIPLKNDSASPLQILSVDPYCDYVEVFPFPSSLEAGEEVLIKGRIDTSGTLGGIAKTLEIMTSASSEPEIVKITVKVIHPSVSPRQIKDIFRGRCGNCHAGADVGSRKGKMLYSAVCYMCHKDYRTIRHLDTGDIRHSISAGIRNTAMPAFGSKDGGPLNEEQIDSLVEVLTEDR